MDKLPNYTRKTNAPGIARRVLGVENIKDIRLWGHDQRTETSPNSVRRLACTRTLFAPCPS